MRKKHIQLSNCKIAAYDIRPENEKAIILLHGNSLASETFTAQLEDRRFEHFRLIAPDFPGHGQSKKNQELYGTEALIRLIKELIDTLQLKNYVLVGHSFGGNVGIEAAEELQNLKGLFLTAAPPLKIPPAQDAFMPVPELQYAFTAELNKEEALALAGGYTAKDALKKELSQMILNTDPMFRGLMAQAIGGGNYKNEAEILKNLNIPVAHVIAENDKMANNEYIKNTEVKNLWKKAVQTIPDAGHSCQSEQPEAFNALLKEFVDEVL